MPPNMPWLPEPGQRPVAPQAPPSTDPYTRAVVHGFNPPTKTPHRRRRIPVVPIVMVLLLLGAGAAAYNKFVGKSGDSSQADGSPQGVTVQTEVFTFVLPKTPTEEPLSNVVAGIQITGTQWTVASGNFNLLALAMNFGNVLDEATQQAAFDAVLTDRAIQASGSIVSDTWILTDGVYQRDTIVVVPGGMIHMKSFGKGAWAVFFSGPSSGSERPPGFTDLITSFSFA